MTTAIKGLPTIDAIMGGREYLLKNSAEDLQGWNSDHPIFDKLVDEIEPKVIVEVGSWKGRSVAHWAAATVALETEIFAVDTWLGGTEHHLSDLAHDDRKLDECGSPTLYHQFLRNFVGKPEASRIHPLQQTSQNGARILRHFGVQADIIYIDGSHEYEDVYSDLIAYAPLLAAGGRMFGDDFRAFPGVFAAVIRYAHERGHNIQEVDHNFWILR